MHPAPSVILFTVLSGAGFGLLAFLGLGQPALTGWPAFWLWGLGYSLTVGGLLASTFHLGHPERALLAFSQWRSSWLSREAWAAVAALVLLAPVALAALFGVTLPAPIGATGALACGVAVLCTAMIYAQLKTVPRWNHWITPVTFAGLALTGGAILSGQGTGAGVLCMALGAVLAAGFRIGDGQFRARGVTLADATGLGGIGTPAVFELPHTGGNYLTREMIHVVGRKHADRLRVMAVVFAGVLPGVILIALPGQLAATVLAAVLHLTGALAARWLFFAQAEHVVGLYYGQGAR
jgi:sulfite dehydrogenase (quinone) subunit SoeC